MDESMEVPQPTQASPAKVFVQRKRAVKDPHAPTRPLSAYLCFLVNKQEEFRRSDPAKQVVAEITRRVGAAWRELSEDQRKIYEIEADKRKAKYLIEMAAYEQTESHRNFVAKKHKEAEDNGISPEMPPAPKKSRQKKHESTPASIARSDSVGSEQESGRAKARQKRPAAGPTQPSVKKSPTRTPVIPPRLREAPAYKPAPELDIYSQPANLAAKLDLSSMTELRVPILTKEFMEWNTQRDKELRQARKLAHELEIDVAGIRTHNEQEAQVGRDIEATKTKLSAVTAARKEVVKLLMAEFRGVPLPSGLRISSENVGAFMAELEEVTGKPTGRSTDLMEKVRDVAVKLQPFMEHLR